MSSPEKLMTDETMVVCRGCKNLRPLSWYHKAKGYRNGLSQCRPCETERHSRRLADPTKKAMTAARARARRAADAELRSREAAAAKAWRAGNPAAVKEYNASIKERVRKINLRAKALGISGNISALEWETILAEHGNACAYCCATEKLGHDHVIPISRGGLNVAENIVPCCQPCNSTKKDRALLEFVISGYERRVA